MVVTVTPLSAAIGVEVTGLSGDRAGRSAGRRRLPGRRRGRTVWSCTARRTSTTISWSRSATCSARSLTVPRGALDGLPRGGAGHPGPDQGRDGGLPRRERSSGTSTAPTTWCPTRRTLLTAKEISDDERRHRVRQHLRRLRRRSPTHEQAELADVRVVHSFAASQLLVSPTRRPSSGPRGTQVPSREHPLVWTRAERTQVAPGRRHRRRGRRADRPSEGRALLDRLLAWATQPQFVVRHHWRRGDLVVWDNTGLLHRALPYALRLAPPDAPHDHRRRGGDRVSDDPHGHRHRRLDRASAGPSRPDWPTTASRSRCSTSTRRPPSRCPTSSRATGHEAMAVGGVDVSDRGPGERRGRARAVRARPGTRAREQRRHHRLQRVPEDHRRALGPDHGGQPQRPLLLLPRPWCPT